VWQYTAIDVASSYVWAEIHTSRRNPDPVRTTGLAHRVAAGLAGHGWELAAITTDNGNEFKANQFTDSLRDAGIEHRFITPGRPQTNGKVEQVQNTILREYWHPALVGYSEPSLTGIRAGLAEYLTWYNTLRPHQGRWNQGKPPATIIEPNTGNHP
jgi:transposase InsO family protein